MLKLSFHSFILQELSEVFDLLEDCPSSENCWILFACAFIIYLNIQEGQNIYLWEVLTSNENTYKILLPGHSSSTQQLSLTTHQQQAGTELLPEKHLSWKRPLRSLNPTVTFNCCNSVQYINTALS